MFLLLSAAVLNVAAALLYRCRHAGQYIHQGAFFNSLNVFLKNGRNIKTADPRGRAVVCMGLRTLACWDVGLNPAEGTDICLL
jgi:hypothetical protein